MTRMTIHLPDGDPPAEERAPVVRRAASVLRGLGHAFPAAVLTRVADQIEDPTPSPALDPAAPPTVEGIDGDPFMPVSTFVDQVHQGIEDYCDGDDPGWFSARWNEDTRELALDYQPDKDAEPQYRGTTHVFRLGAQARVGGPSLGEVAYAGYKASTRGISLVSGASLPPWGELEPEMQAAWQAAADAARTAS